MVEQVNSVSPVFKSQLKFYIGPNKTGFLIFKKIIKALYHYNYYNYL